MNGSGLLGFIISLIVLFAVGAIFFLTIDRVAKDPFLAKIAKIVIGCLILIAFARRRRRCSASAVQAWRHPPSSSSSSRSACWC